MVLCLEFYKVGGGGTSEFHTFANIQILSGRAGLEHMSACLFDLIDEHLWKIFFIPFTILCRLYNVESTSSHR